MPYKDKEVAKAAARRRKDSSEGMAFARDWHKRRDRKERKNLEILAGRVTPELCELCGKPPTQRGLHFDHCHQKGHFRGWICNRCNVALGMVNDDVQVLRKMIAYIERNRENTAPQLVLAGI